jgi:hypothetical protein
MIKESRVHYENPLMWLKAFRQPRPFYCMNKGWSTFCWNRTANRRWLPASRPLSTGSIVIPPSSLAFNIADRLGLSPCYFSSQFVTFIMLKNEVLFQLFQRIRELNSYPITNYGKAIQIGFVHCSPARLH